MTGESTIEAHLHHLELVTPDPQRLTSFYGDVMGMTCHRIDAAAIACTAPGRRILLTRGEHAQLGYAAYAFTDPAAFDAFRRRLKAAETPTMPWDSPWFGKQALSIIDPDGTRLMFSLVEDEDDPSGNRLPARLQHFVMASPNCTKIADFYERTLGFQVSDRVYREPDVLTSCFLRSTNEHHSFAVFQAPVRRLDHHCYEANSWMDIRDWGDHLAGFRIPVDWGPGRHGPGNNLFLFVRDPDGNAVEISAELELVSAGKVPGRWAHEERTLNLWGKAPLRSEGRAPASL